MAFLRLGPYLFNEVPRKKEKCQKAKPKPKRTGTIPQKPPVVVVKTPKKRGRPRKIPVSLAPIPAPVLAEPELEPGLILTRTRRKVKPRVHYGC